jgi:superfamily II DNA or RNA helicase
MSVTGQWIPVHLSAQKNRWRRGNSDILTNQLENLRFKFPWRSYQKRVLEELDGHLEDDQLHVVAAPGSGKTVLGLEVMRRLGKPALIFAPSLAIRNQWKTRLVELFLAEGADDSWISLNIRDPRFLTISTYQGLHAALSGETDEEGCTQRLQIDALLQSLRQQNVETLVFDEAHHLRKEWHKSLVELKEALQGRTRTVSLTATPPYDCDAAEWARYENLCGVVDSEISVPELVKSGDLSPHQDLVCFSAPTGPDADFISKFAKDLNGFAYELLRNEAFLFDLADMPWFRTPENFEDEIFRNTDFYLAGLVFLKAAGRTVHPAALDLFSLSFENLPELDRTFLERLLTGVISEDPSSYFSETGIHKKLLQQLRAFGGLKKGRPELADLDEVNKRLRNSLGKIRSIQSIVAAESTSLQSGLRLVILTDYIRRDQMPGPGQREFTPEKIGVVPIFEVLRSKGAYQYRLGVLTGSLVILPAEAEAAFRTIAEGKGIARDDVRVKSLRHDEDYVEVELKGPLSHEMVHVVTEVFQQGEVTVLVGTQSLLGEGWDAPSINSLVLASIVGSFMLSNQMRGRAIRIDPDVSTKVANIWHLACVNLPDASGVFAKLGAELNLLPNSGVADPSWRPISEDLGEDVSLLVRRFKAFEGLSVAEPVLIETGLGRLGFADATWTVDGLVKTNGGTFARSADRDEVWHRWRRTLHGKAKGARLRPSVRARRSQQQWVYRKSLASLSVGSLSFLLFFFALFAGMTKLFSLEIAAIMLFSMIAIFLVLSPKLFRAGYLLLRNGSVEGNLQQIGQAVLETLRDTNQLQTQLARLTVVVSKGRSNYFFRLEGAKPKERESFLQAIEHILGPIGNPKYMVKRRSRFLGKESVDYHPVPDAFSTRKNQAETFVKHWVNRVSDAELVSVRSKRGRKLLLQARTSAFSAHFVPKSERMGRWE